MGFDPGALITALAAIAFYFRLIRIQRKRLSQQPQNNRNLIRRWPVAIVSIALALVGAFMAAQGVNPETAQPYWWIPITLAFLVFQFAI
jgi:hypothetical protein